MKGKRIKVELGGSGGVAMPGGSGEEVEEPAKGGGGGVRGEIGGGSRTNS